MLNTKHVAKVHDLI